MSEQSVLKIRSVNKFQAGALVSIWFITIMILSKDILLFTVNLCSANMLSPRQISTEIVHFSSYSFISRRNFSEVLLNILSSQIDGVFFFSYYYVLFLKLDVLGPASCQAESENNANSVETPSFVPVPIPAQIRIAVLTVRLIASDQFLQLTSWIMGFFQVKKLSSQIRTQ